MKLKELVEKYGEYDVVLSERIAKSEIMIEGRKPENRTVWDLKDGDSYYWIEGLGYIKGHYFWKTESADFAARDIGNIFLTKEEAEKDLERRKVENLLLKFGGRRWFNGYNHNFYIGLDEYEEHLKAYILMTPTQGTIYFDSKDNARKAIDEIGEERIKKALFEVR